MNYFLVIALIFPIVLLALFLVSILQPKKKGEIKDREDREEEEEEL